MRSRLGSGAWQARSRPCPTRWCSAAGGRSASSGCAACAPGSRRPAVDLRGASTSSGRRPGRSSRPPWRRGAPRGGVRPRWPPTRPRPRRRSAAKVLEVVGRRTAAATAPLAAAALAVGERPAPLRAALLRAAPRSRPVPATCTGTSTACTRVRRPAAHHRRRPPPRARVVFGSPKAPRASVADASLASCSIPWVFAPVKIGGREYVDGGVWSPSNADAVPGGARRRGALPAAAAVTPRRRGAAGAARRVADDGVRRGRRLRARGARVRVVAPDARVQRGDRAERDGRPRRRDVFAAGWAQGRRWRLSGSALRRVGPALLERGDDRRRVPDRAAVVAR